MAKKWAELGRENGPYIISEVLLFCVFSSNSP